MNDDVYLSVAVNLYESKVWDEKQFRENVLKHAKEVNIDETAINDFLNRVLPKKGFTLDEKKDFLSNLTFKDGSLKYPNAVEHMDTATIDKLFELENNSKKNETVNETSETKSQNVNDFKFNGKFLITAIKRLNPDAYIKDVDGLVMYSDRLNELHLPVGFKVVDNRIVNATNDNFEKDLSLSVVLVHKVNKNIFMQAAANDAENKIEVKEEPKTEVHEKSESDALEKSNDNKEEVPVLPNIMNGEMYTNDNKASEQKEEPEKEEKPIDIASLLPDIFSDEAYETYKETDEPKTEEEYEEVKKNITSAESDSDVKEVNASEERINKLKSKKGKIINKFIKTAIVVTSVLLLSPTTAALGIGGYLYFANKIKSGEYNPTSHFGQAIASVVKKIMNIGMSEEEIERGKSK